MLNLEAELVLHCSHTVLILSKKINKINKINKNSYIYTTTKADMISLPERGT